MKLTQRQLKAIAAFAQERGYAPQISVPPTIYFKKANGDEVQVDMVTILAFYDSQKKNKKKAVES